MTIHFKIFGYLFICFVVYWHWLLDHICLDTCYDRPLDNLNKTKIKVDYHLVRHHNNASPLRNFVFARIVRIANWVYNRRKLIGLLSSLLTWIGQNTPNDNTRSDLTSKIISIKLWIFGATSSICSTLTPTNVHLNGWFIAW